MEEWKDIPCYEGAYQVSNLGRVRSLDRCVPHKSFGSWIRKGKLLSTARPSQLYPTVCLSLEGHTYLTLVHRLVALAFLGDPPPGRPEVNHKNGDKSDCAADNLEWCSRAQNQQHAYDNGFAHSIGSPGPRPNRRGELNPVHKLTAQSVLEIRHRYAAGFVSMRDLGREYGVCHEAIRKIILRRTWTDL